MTEELKRVTASLLRASPDVGQDYFLLPVAGGDEAFYRERVYCYELYGRWRRWPEPSPYSLCGEGDKAQHPVIPWTEKPDILVHVPGQMRNLLIVEVKSARAPVGDVMDDLEKLGRFVHGAR